MIDVDFDCRTEATKPKSDPDAVSRTLRHNHQYIWNKPLPNGKLFELDISCRMPLLTHRSELGIFELTSDHMRRTLADRVETKNLVNLLTEQLKQFAEDRAWLVSDCILFPCKKVDGKMTINGARGMNSRIGDRFDLTLECIRRHYDGEKSPLADAIARYAGFFRLFESFEGYVNFFMLQDLVDSGLEKVKYHLPFDNFQCNAVPRDLDSYIRYLASLQEFHARRADRVRSWCGEKA